MTPQHFVQQTDRHTIYFTPMMIMYRINKFHTTSSEEIYWLKSSRLIRQNSKSLHAICRRTNLVEKQKPQTNETGYPMDKPDTTALYPTNNTSIIRDSRANIMDSIMTV